MPQKQKKSQKKNIVEIDARFKIHSFAQKKIQLSPQKIKEAVIKKEKEIRDEQLFENEEAPLLAPKNLETIFPSEIVRGQEITSLENVIAISPAPQINNQNTTTLLPYALNTKQASDNYALSSGYTMADNYGMQAEEKNLMMSNNREQERNTIPFSHDIDVNSLQQGYVNKKTKKPR
ncbi:MAG: hypothetical protein AABX16_02045 [Nanoarchaeota archaeon]